MYGREPAFRRISFGGLSGPPPVDVIVLVAVVFATFSVDILTGGGLSILRLGADAVQRGFLWQILTYPLIGWGVASPWIFLELLILFWFAKDVFWRLGRERFWWLLGWAAGIGGIVALGTLFLGRAVGWGAAAAPETLEQARSLGLVMPELVLLQGQRTLLAIVIAAFATLYADRTIYFLFVLPMRAGWFVWLGILFAFIGFLQTRDLAGFLGVCTAVGVTVVVLRWGGPGKALRRGWLHLRRRQLESQIARERKKRGLRVVDGGKSDGGPWLNRVRLAASANRC